MNDIEFLSFEYLTKAIGVKDAGRYRCSNYGTTCMNRDRPADKEDIVIVRRIVGARGWEDILNLMPHLGELFTQTENMLIYSTWICIVIRGDLYDFHLSVATLSVFPNYHLFLAFAFRWSLFLNGSFGRGLFPLASDEFFGQNVGLIVRILYWR